MESGRTIDITIVAKTFYSCRSQPRRLQINAARRGSATFTISTTRMVACQPSIRTGVSARDRWKPSQSGNLQIKQTQHSIRVYAHTWESITRLPVHDAKNTFYRCINKIYSLCSIAFLAINDAFGEELSMTLTVKLDATVC